ncbi:DUF2760 domain-containing protein [Thiospirillum jenense]|uniref:DUF2760 domain-containing protein n=2 Tax=Thiospirillum jenense TaxID=1653858 RepID=A0A839HHF0_9GAMM|nr:DUF2760 domain-containing protein [Thiospirillum jenense]
MANLGNSDNLEPLASKFSAARVILSNWLRIAGQYIAHYAVIIARNTWIVLTRLPIAVFSFIKALASADYADLLRTLYADNISTINALPSVTSAALQPSSLQQSQPDSALLLLGLLQKEGRFVDFLQEDITNYADQDIGAAARVVHQGCQRVLRQHLEIQPVFDQPEGSPITLERGFDPAVVRPTGQVVGDPPFHGALVHRGWRATAVHLPQVAVSRDLHVLAAAEVEL